MFTIARALQAIDETWNAKPSEPAPTWNTPVQHDATLVAQLVGQYDELDASLAAIIGNLESEGSAQMALACSEDLHKLRHTEALRLFPIIARGLTPDPVARRLFWQSRLVMLGLARRVFRRFDELVRALRAQTGAATAAQHLTKALAEYRQRNESEIYPLYALAGRRDGGVAAAG